MSKETAIVDNIAALTSFYGGVDRGRCVQVTPISSEYLQLTERQAVELATALLVWATENK